MDAPAVAGGVKGAARCAHAHARTQHMLTPWRVRLARAGVDFPAFPFPPYGIQLDLMRHIYATLDAGGVGVFESPTGTVRARALRCLHPNAVVRFALPCADALLRRVCAPRVRACLCARA
jgi:hypothetical protein